MRNLIKRILTEHKIKNATPNIKGEIKEIERAAQDLNRGKNFTVTVKDIIEEFNGSSPQPLYKEIWDKLENTESNEIEPGDFKSVFKIADMYNKSNPLKLVRKLRAGTYQYPLIVRFEDDRYHLVAGNTRLSTAAALGVTPMVFIADINKPYPVGESVIKK